MIHGISAGFFFCFSVPRLMLSSHRDWRRPVFRRCSVPNTPDSAHPSDAPRAQQPLAARMRPRTSMNWPAKATSWPRDNCSGARHRGRPDFNPYFLRAARHRENLHRPYHRPQTSAFVRTQRRRIQRRRHAPDLRRRRKPPKTRAQSTLLFIDEIHRFNKAQQDVLLPDVKAGMIRLIGATTHNPFFLVNSPLVSRSQLSRCSP